MVVVSRSVCHGHGSRLQSGVEKSRATALTSLGRGGSGNGRPSIGRNGRTSGARRHCPPCSISTVDATCSTVWCLITKTKRAATSGVCRQIVRGGRPTPCLGRSSARRKTFIDDAKGVGPTTVLDGGGGRGEARVILVTSMAFKGLIW